MQGHIRYDFSKGNGRYFAEKSRVTPEQKGSFALLTIDPVIIVLVFGSALVVVLSKKFDR